MSEAVVLALIATIPPTVASVGAIIVSLRTKAKVDSLSINVDGRLTQLLEANSAAKLAEGHIAGRAESDRTRGKD